MRDNLSHFSNPFNSFPKFTVFSLVVLLALALLLSISGISPQKPEVAVAQPLQAATSLPDTPTTVPTSRPTPVTILERDYGSWHFIAQRDEHLSISIDYPSDSIAGLDEYAQANRSLADQLANGVDPVEVVITFRSLISPEQFREWVAARGLVVNYTGLRTIVTEWNDRGSLGVKAQLDDVLPEAPLNPSDATVLGVFETRGTVDPLLLPVIASDPLVFITDVTPTFVRNTLIAEGLSVDEVTHADLRIHSPFWEMEDIGLENFR